MKKIFLVTCLMVVFLVPGVKADEVIATLPSFTGPESFDLPLPTLTVGTFSYAIPMGQQISAAIFSGTFGSSVFDPNSAPVDLRLDSLLVAQCMEGSPCTFALSPTSFSFSVPSSSFSLLSDGMATLSAIQTGFGAVRLGQMTLTLQTAPAGAPIPEPATMILLGTGLVGVAARARRRRSNSRR